MYFRGKEDKMENMWKKPESWEVRKIVEYGKDAYTQKKKESLHCLALVIVLFLLGCWTCVYKDLCNEAILVRRVTVVGGGVAGMGLIELLYLSLKKQALARIEAGQFAVMKATVEDKRSIHIHGRAGGGMFTKDGTYIGNGDWLCLDQENDIYKRHWFRTSENVYQNVTIGKQVTLIRYDGNKKGFYGKIDVTDVLN